MAADPMERDLADIGAVRRTGVHAPETSFYPALEALLTEIGRRLCSRVRQSVILRASAPLRESSSFPVSTLPAPAKGRDRVNGLVGTPLLVLSQRRGGAEGSFLVAVFIRMPERPILRASSACSGSDRALRAEAPVAAAGGRGPRSAIAATGGD